MKKLKVVLKKWEFYAIVLLIAFTAPRLITQFSRNKAIEGLVAQQAMVFGEGGKTITLPLKDGKPSVVVFWATWCGPCKVEFQHINSLVKDGKIDKSRFFAVSSGEELELVLKTAKEREYGFEVYADTSYGLAKQFEISGTPTTVFFDGDGKVTSASTGIGPVLAYRIADHLSGK